MWKATKDMIRYHTPSYIWAAKLGTMYLVNNYWTNEHKHDRLRKNFGAQENGACAAARPHTLPPGSKFNGKAWSEFPELPIALQRLRVGIWDRDAKNLMPLQHLADKSGAIAALAPAATSTENIFSSSRENL